jgi:preprotein translocase subunit Sec61beta
MPGVLGDIIDNNEIGGMQITPELLLAMAILVLVPLVMAFLVLTLKESMNRWLNIVVGAVFVVIELLELTDLAANPSAALTLIWLLKTAAPLLIIWYAWKSKQKA